MQSQTVNALVIINVVFISTTPLPPMNMVMREKNRSDYFELSRKDASYSYRLGARC